MNQLLIRVCSSIDSGANVHAPLCYCSVLLTLGDLLSVLFAMREFWW